MTTRLSTVGLALCVATRGARRSGFRSRAARRPSFAASWAVSPSVVWASGTHGRVAHTTDGGSTWTIDSLPDAGALDFRAIAPRNPRWAWVNQAPVPPRTDRLRSSTPPTVRHWEKQFSTQEKGVFLDAIAFWDDTHGSR